MPERKYLTEYAALVISDYFALLQQNSLKDEFCLKTLNSLKAFHIYTIVQRPRIAFDPAAFQIKKDIITGVYTVQRGSVFERRNFLLKNKSGTDELKIECPYPNTEFKIFDLNGELLIKTNTTLLLSNFKTYRECLDLKVLYVGQSYGKSGARTALDRLQSHSTLQEIYADASGKSPDKEIWIVLMSFEEISLMICIAGNIKKFQTTTEQNSEHVEKAFKTTLSLEQQINLIEATLIKYFKPEYNTVLKDSFPSQKHRTYTEYYDLDFNAVILAIGTEPLRFRLWSDAAPAAWCHSEKFDLHNSKERKSIFDVFES